MRPSPSYLREFFPIEVQSDTKIRDLCLEKLNVRLKEINTKQADALQSNIGTGYKDSLNINAFDIFVGGWIKAHEILKYGNIKKYPPEKNYEVALTSHRIISEHEPVMEVRSAEVIIAEFRLIVKLTLNFDVAILKIYEGRIVGISSGKYRAEGSVKFGHLLLSKLSSADYHFPGEVDFTPGYKIPQPKGWFG